VLSIGLLLQQCSKHPQSSEVKFLLPTRLSMTD